MSDDNTQNQGASGADSDAGNGDTGAADAGSAGGTQGDQGAATVPAADLSRAQETARSLQSERDREKARADKLDAELAALRGTSGGSEGGSGGAAPVDLEDFRRSLLADVHGVTALSQAAIRLQTEFPYADAALFAPGKLAEFHSPEALFLAAKDSHDRASGLIEAEVAKREAALRADFEKKYGPGAAGEGNGTAGTAGGTGDPTKEQLARMSMRELDELETRAPGTAARVLRSTTTT